MRDLLFVAALALAGCNPGITPQNQTVPHRKKSGPSPAMANQSAVPANKAEPAPAATPDAAPDLSEMSPYRRREYERGYRDCMTGNFDGERQGESYRIGCMAAEDAKQRR